MTSNDIPSSFIVVYYNSFVYEPSKLIQFYDESARVWRQSMSSSEGQNVNEAKDLLAIDIPIGTDFRVLSFQSCPIDNGYSILVTASLNFEGNTKVLNQSFVLQLKYERWFVISDILTINDLSNILPNVETTPVKNNATNPNTNEKQNYQQHPKSKKQKQNDQFNYNYSNT